MRKDIEITKLGDLSMIPNFGYPYFSYMHTKYGLIESPYIVMKCGVEETYVEIKDIIRNLGYDVGKMDSITPYTSFPIYIELYSNKKVKSYRYDSDLPKTYFFTISTQAFINYNRLY